HTRCLSDWSSDVCSSDLNFLTSRCYELNNRRKTRDLFTTNPKQYLQLLNFEKYDHVYDAQLNFINRKTKAKGTFDFNELTHYLRSGERRVGKEYKCHK